MFYFTASSLLFRNGWHTKCAQRHFNLIGRQIMLMELGYVISSTRNFRITIQVCSKTNCLQMAFQFPNNYRKKIIPIFCTIADNQNQLQLQVWHSQRMKSTISCWAVKMAMFIQVRKFIEHN